MKQDTLEGKAKTKNGIKRLCFSIICILLEVIFIITIVTRLNEFSYGEQITITPRNYEFDFRFAGKIKSHYALIGMAFVAEGYPLYYSAI